MKRAYYNEIDPFAAQWLRNLITCEYIAPGDVDERDIRDVHPNDLLNYSQCHFFAGIGIWSHALRSAGWSDDRPVWTGSCPCQPFSAAGRREGVADERHLWPHFHHLIRECRPSVVFGEQVASKDGLAWLDLVQSDLEGEGYAVGALDLCAAGIGAPHIRQRLYWVAGTDQQGSGGRRVQGLGEGDSASDWAACERPAGLCSLDGLADTDNSRSQRRNERRYGANECVARSGGVVERLADTESRRRGEFRNATFPRRGGYGDGGVEVSWPGPTNGFWGTADWLFCRDGKWRPVKSGTFPLVDGYPSRMGTLRAYGNAIVAPLAEEFIRAYLGA